MNRLVKFVWFLIGVLLFCLAILAVNQETAALRFLVWRTPELSLFWWLLAAFALGLIVGGTAISLLTLTGRVRERSLRRQLAAAERELERLKTIG